MTFKARNLYYLRISEQSVLPTYVCRVALSCSHNFLTKRKVYLDERHLDWMSDQVLQHVLADLRPRILPKLLAETGALSNPATSKKVAVDTHRGDTYQFCYFLRRTEPHSIILKTRNYVAKKAEQPMTTRGLGSLKTVSRDGLTDDRNTGKKRKLRSTAKDAVSPPPPRSTKKRKSEQVASNEPSSEEEGPVLQAGDQSSIVEVDQDETPIDVDMEDAIFNLPIDEEEEKPKPALQLKYKGFSIYGQCLCIVVEPWPTVHIAKGPLGSQKAKHEKSHAQTSTPVPRAQTPLFLADDDMGQEDSFAQTSHDLNSDDDSDGGMMAFSQALNLAGDNRPGAAEDEQEMEGAVLFGDADENRQL